MLDEEMQALLRVAYAIFKLIESGFHSLYYYHAAPLQCCCIIPHYSENLYYTLFVLIPFVVRYSLGFIFYQI